MPNNIGAFGENFPYTNFHDLNLNWIIEIIKDFKTKYPNIIEELNKKLNSPVLNPNGEPNQILVSNGDGSTSWIDINEEYAPIIYNAVNEWLEEHPEATTTVEDNSITLPKINDRLKLDIEKTPLFDLNFTPHFSYRHNDTMYMYQSACEFEYENDKYLALGYFKNNTNTSGMLLFKNGTLIVDKFGNDYGHLNTITYCPVDNKLYVASTGTLPFTHIAFKCDATTLENKEDLDFYSGILMWSDGYFYTWRPPHMSRRKYGETEWEDVYTIEYDNQTQTVQTCVILNGYCYFQLMNKSISPDYYKDGTCIIKVYSPENKLVYSYSLNTLYEPEQLYVFNNKLYMLVDEQCYDSSTYETYPRATIFCLSELHTKDNVVRNIEYNKIYFSDNNGYGDGTATTPTSSPLACLLSRITIVNISTHDFLPVQANILTNKEFIGDATTKPKICFIGLRTDNVRFSNITIGGAGQQEMVLDDAKVTFDYCVFDLKDMFEHNVRFYCRGTDMIFNFPVFRGYFDEPAQQMRTFVSYTNSTSGTVTLNINNDVFDLKNAIIQNATGGDDILFSINIPLTVHIGTTSITDNTLQELTNITLLPRIGDSIHESGTFDLNKLTAPSNITFNSGATLEHAPANLQSGRKLLVVTPFGSTSGKMQLLYTHTGNIYMRYVTGANTMTFDSNGAITTNLTWQDWVQIH